jgi:hypothetical protein
MDPNAGEVLHESLEADFEPFVRGRERFVETDPDTQRGLIVIEGEDGSVLVRGAGIDGTTCEQIQNATGDAKFCLPGRTTQNTPFEHATDTCEGADVVPSFEREACGNTRPSFALEFSHTTNGCAELLAIRELGDEVDTYYQGNEQNCTAGTPSGDTHYYEFGPEIPMDELLTLPIAQSGTGRLRTSFASINGKPASTNVEWYDTDLDVACGPQLLADGERRCLPSNANVTFSGSNFSDDACTEDLWLAYRQTCGENSPYLVELDAEGSCGATVTSVQSLVPYEGTVYEDIGNGCEEKPAEEGILWYSEGDVVPLSDFALVELVTE